jgi:hypothetical protein
VTGATTLLGTVLNAACSGPKRLRLRDEPNSEPSQHPSNVKNEGDIKNHPTCKKWLKQEALPGNYHNISNIHSPSLETLNVTKSQE